MKIFITGITGFVGSHCAIHFSSAGHEVWGIGRKKDLPSHIPKQCRYRRADICESLPDIEADIIIHTAALASDTATFEACYKANVEGTKNVLAACKNVKHFIHISSSSVYNFIDGKPKKEDDAGRNFEQLSSYGKTKWLAEEEVRRENHFDKTTILRPRAIYGKYDGVLLPRLLRLVKGNRLLLPAHLSEKISLTSIINLIAAIEDCIHKQSVDSAVFNVADDKVYSLYKLLTTLLPAVTAKSLRIVNIPSYLFDFIVKANERLQLSPHLNSLTISSLLQQAVLNTDAIHSHLAYSPVTDFNQQFREIINWIYEEEGWRYYFTKRPEK